MKFSYIGDDIHRWPVHHLRDGVAADLTRSLVPHIEIQRMTRTKGWSGISLDAMLIQMRIAPLIGFSSTKENLSSDLRNAMCRWILVIDGTLFAADVRMDSSHVEGRI